jgi:hypothetical protein
MLPDGQSVRGRERARRRRRGRSALLWIGRLVALGLAFWIGLALGRALEEAPQPGGTQERVRPLVPTTVSPQATVTITVSNS